MGEPRSIKQAEARDRAELVAVARYDLELDLTGLLDDEELRATSRIWFRCRDTAAETFVDCLADVEEASLNGRPLPTGRVPGGRIALTGLADKNELIVRSVQIRTAAAQGVHRVVDPSDAQVYMWTILACDEARRIFACFDQPDLKAVFGITAVVPRGWTATSNSGSAEVEFTSRGERWVFPDTPPLSTYVLTVNAGPLYEVRSQRDGYDLGLFCRQSLAAQLDRDAEELFDLTARGLRFYGDQFGLPFPQHRYDQVFLPDVGGAMESYGCVTWDDFFLYRTPPSHADREKRAMFLLHEMAHMWFGDLVTMRWWDDLWLNESFADWAAHWAAAGCTEFTEAWATQLVGLKQQAYRADMSPISHPIRQPIPDVETALAVFDAITYPKGASVLRQLVELVGEPVFVEALRGYFAKHAWSNTTLDDLVSELEAASGRDLSDWVTGWLTTSGTDRLVVTRENDRAHVHVEAPPRRGPLQHRLDVGVYVERSGRLLRAESRAMELQGEVTLDAVDPDALLLVNDNDLTFASVLPDPVSLEQMLTRGGDLPTPLSRSLAVTTAWDLLVRDQISTAAFVGCAVQVLRQETASSVVEPLLGLATKAADVWAPPTVRDRLLTEVADLAMQLVRQPEHRLAAVRTLAASATTEPQLAALAELVTDPDLRWRRLTRLAELDRLDDQEAVRLEHDDPNPDAWQSALVARAARPSHSAKQEAWDRSFAEEAALGPIGVQDLGTAMWRPGQEELLRPFAEDFLRRLPAISQRAMVTATSLSASLLPLAGIDASYLDELEAAVDATRSQRGGAPNGPRTIRHRAQDAEGESSTRLLTGHPLSRKGCPCLR